MPKKKVLICTRVSEPMPVAPGDLKVAYSECRELVWVSPSSWTIVHDNPEINIICTDCAVAEAIDARSIRIHDITPAQLDDIGEYLEMKEK